MLSDFDFSDIVDLLEGDEFDEKPVSIETFVTNDTYLNLPPLSDYQYQMLKASTQIYKKNTLERLYGEKEGQARWKQTYNEVILQLGKGSGKDYISTIACAYVVYLLLCLKDPARYYGKPPGDAIDIINIAVNAAQAKGVFFKGLKNKIERSPWFAGKHHIKNDMIEFDKTVTVHAGHSEREAWEGLNLIFCVLDEIAAFAIENTSGNVQAKTAQDVYSMFRASIDSRFPEVGKVILLSFPRYRGDFIQQRYNDVIAEKNVVIKEHTFKIDDELPDNVEENQFSIEWEEDQIVSYYYPKVFALRRPTWEVNPTININDLKVRFMADPVDSLSRFACMPPDAVDAFFPSKEKIEHAFRNPQQPIKEDGSFESWFRPIDDKEYFIHVDLAQKHDRCAVTLAHAEAWVKTKVMGQEYASAPKIIIDAIKYWTPTKQTTVDFTDVKNYILDLKRMGFNIKLVTFDRWNSHDIMQQLKDYGLPTDTLSVAKKHYEDMKLAIAEERVYGPINEILIEELIKLRIVKDKVDHPRTGSKDLADATCGAIYNVIAHARRDSVQELEIYTFGAIMPPAAPDTRDDNVIRPPKESMPDNLKSYFHII